MRLARSRENPAGKAEAHRAVVLAALALAAMNLRPALASVGPLLPAIRRDVGLSGAGAGLLTTVPSLCFGICAPLAPRLAVRFGIERTIVVALVFIGAATCLRSTGGAAALFATTLVAGVAIAVTQTLLPAVVKSRFATRAVLATGVYALSINLGALFAASLSAPAAAALGGSWAAALAIWSALAPTAVLVWLVVARRRFTSPAPVPTALGGLPWRSRGAWMLTLYMAGLSVIYIVSLTWIAPLYHNQGYSAARAGAVLSVFAGAQILSGLVVPPIAHRRGDRRWWFAVTIGAVGLGLLGMAVAPMASPWLWAALEGLGMGGAFPLTLTLFVELAATPEQSGQLTAMGFCGGYLLAAAGPAGAGAIADATGSLELPFAAIAAVAFVMVAVTRPVMRARVGRA